MTCIRNNWLPLLAAVLSAVFLVWEFQTNFAFNQTYLINLRTAIYTALIGCFASILGFVVTAAAILLAIDTEKHLQLLAAAKVLRPMFEQFIRTIYCITLALVLSFACLICDRDPCPPLPYPSSLALSDILLAVSAVSLGCLLQTVNTMKGIGSVQLANAQNTGSQSYQNANAIPPQGTKF